MNAAAATRAILPTEPYRVRLAAAMAVSLLIHALIISLQFGIPGIGLPTLEMPWRERRAQASDLSVVLVNPASSPRTPETSAKPSAPPTAITEAPRTGLQLVPAPKAAKSPVPDKPVSRQSKEKAASAPRPPRTRARAKRETPVIALNETRENSFSMPAPAVDENPTPSEPEEVVPPSVALPAPAENTPVEDPAQRERERAEQMRGEDETTQRVRDAEERTAQLLADVQAEQRNIEAARRQDEEAAQLARQRELALEAQRADEAKGREDAERLALELEERRKAEEVSRREATVLALQKQQDETLRHERDDATRRALELEEKQRAEALRLHVEQLQRAQREELEVQVLRQAEAAAEAARLQTARERERQAEELAARRKAETEAARASRRERDPELMLGASPGPNARNDALPPNRAGSGLADRALELARRSDMLQEAPPRDALPAPSARQSDSGMDSPRRRSIFGSKDVDVGLRMYVESWRLKIERNGSIYYSRASADKAKGDAVVTVAIHSDGSVEDVIIHRSSGQPDLDEAVRRIVRVNARYSAFPPDLAHRFDVIEIRQVWNFDSQLRILEEVR